MKSSRLLWSSILIVAIITTSIFIYGFVNAIQTVVYPNGSNLTEPEAEIEEEIAPSADEIIILSLGDSLTKGTGDKTNNGYVGVVRNLLEENKDKPVYLRPFAVDGYTTEQLLDFITTQSGVRTAIKESNLILMTIGGNDMFSPGNELDLQTSEQLMKDALANISKVFAELNALNAEADIVYVGLYNPFSEIDENGEVALFVQEWNHEVFKMTTAYKQVMFVPTSDLFYKNTKSFLSSDVYHPNEEGYKRIGERIVNVLQ
ncbi:GDSL-type esterase/lipase family protein [Chengkuizengella axinellae]|uniref:GDSL-type esterase/lipase family protein n=1 Tax=Chengkuizengella axinellae TaxID=3064388 RepID=A0ABT9IYL8_9BACL|nr:GDSL-type esterase/lipase family protein [Chengkuizengella sp. 2205SS18-9]MDP5273899.1 GDSL-type esterase/lipase family protein [Chengkuizengella sp. 2205SS18-9]